MVESLARQMAFAPAGVRDRQLGAAEELLISLEPDKAYPPDYVVFRITGYHPRGQTQSELLTGLALQHDLGLLIEQVSDTLSQKTIDRTEPILTIDDLTARFNVTSKTIQRWRRRGLAARRFVFPDGKRRVGFRLTIVEQFLATHRENVERGANFSQVDTSERDLILAKARRLATHCRCCQNEIARRIARKLNRSPLTVLSTIRKHDAEHPEDAIFAIAAPALSEPQKQQVLNAINAGRSMREAAREVGRSCSAVYRVVLEARLAALTRQKVKFIDDPLYHDADAESLLDQMLKQEQLTAHPSPEETRVPADLPAYLRSLYQYPLLTPARERALFLKFNYAKFKLHQARRRIDPAKVRARDLDELETLTRQAADVKNEIVRANLRLVVSIAKKHQRPGVSLMELVSEGNITLMRAVESFDVHKGHKFSTYATLAIMKGFARTVPALQSAAARSSRASELLPDLADRGARHVEMLATREQAERLLSRLNHDEQAVLRAQFGLTDAAGDTRRELALSRHRVREIERAALEKLRHAAGVG